MKVSLYNIPRQSNWAVEFLCNSNLLKVTAFIQKCHQNEYKNKSTYDRIQNANNVDKKITACSIIIEKHFHFGTLVSCTANTPILK